MNFENNTVGGITDVVCVCHRCLDGYVDYNGRCELKDREKKDDKWTAIEIFLFVSVIVLIVMVLCLCICICSLCAKTSRGRVSAVYDHGPAFSGIKT